MRECDIFGAALRTRSGARLALAGLCLKGRAEECSALMDGLHALDFPSAGPTEIDLALASALSGLYAGRAVAVGACVYIEGISDSVYRTGGVLGRPEDSAEDADSDLDRLDEDMWMFTAPGGPGWIAFASRDAAERLAAETVSGSGAYTIRVNNTFRELMRVSPEAYLFISDGTGYDSFGICAAKLGEMELSFIV